MAPAITNFSQIPHTMRNEPLRWGCWRMEERNGKPTKVPFSVLTGHEAGSTRPDEWADFPTAASYYITRRTMDGLGFRLGEGWAGVDLDGCRNRETGEIHPMATEIAQALDSYTEISPSGTGLKIFCFGSLPKGRRRKRAPWEPLSGEKSDIEMYDSGRYFCVTGKALPFGMMGDTYEISECTPQLEILHQKLFPAKVEAAPAYQSPSPELEDNEIIGKMLAAKNGSAILALWNGDVGAHGSRSEADLALVSHIAFYVGRNPARIDKLFRLSRLFREKWDQKHGDQTYGAMTIEKALSDAREFYGTRTKLASGVRSEGLPWWRSLNPT